MKFGNVVFDDVVEYQRLCKCFFQLWGVLFIPDWNFKNLDFLIFQVLSPANCIRDLK